MREMTDAIDELHRLWDDALFDAVDAYQSAETKKAAQGDVKKQARADEESSFKKDKYFDSQISKWDNLSHGSYVKVGTISESHPLAQVGMPASILRYDVSKLKKNMQDHSDYLSIELLRAIPEIIANPVAIAEFSVKNTVSVFGNYFVGTSPMMVGVTISKDRAGNDISKVRTYNTRKDVGNLITNDTVLYLNENKKRTLKWFQACGIRVPLGGTKFGFIRSISQNSENVNSFNEKISNNDWNKGDNSGKSSSFEKKQAREKVPTADELGINKKLKAQNKKLRGDVRELRELLRLQKEVTHGKKFKKSSIEAAASVLMKRFELTRGKEKIWRSSLKSFMSLLPHQSS